MAVGASRVLTLTYAANTSRLNKANQEAETGLGKLGKSFKAFGKVAAVGAAAAATAAVAVGKKLFEAGEAAATANARIENITESMDLFGDEAGTVSGRLVDLANQQAKLTGVSRTTIKETSALLLTFRSVASSADEVGGTFDRAQQAALDLAAAGFGSATSNAQSLGKALEDPIKGLASLGRQGVTFTDVEKERIKVLVESNRIGEAQAIVLEAIEKQVGGTAAATATASERIRESFGVLTDEIALALAPTFEKLTDAALRLVERLQELWVIHGPRIIEFVQRAQKRFSEWFVELRDRFGPVFRDLISRVRDFIDVVREWWQRVSPGVTEAFRTLREPIRNLFDAFRDTWNAVRDLFGSLTEVFAAFRTGEREGSGFERFIRILVGSVNLVVSAMTFWQRIIQQVLDALQRLVESRWFSLAIDGLQRIIDLWNRARGLSESPIAPPAEEAPRGGTPPRTDPVPRDDSRQTTVFNINTGIGDPAAIAREIRRTLTEERARAGDDASARNLLRGL
jgi:prophage DNA circulation protein